MNLINFTKYILFISMIFTFTLSILASDEKEGKKEMRSPPPPHDFKNITHLTPGRSSVALEKMMKASPNTQRQQAKIVLKIFNSGGDIEIEYYELQRKRMAILQSSPQGKLLRASQKALLTSPIRAGKVVHTATAEGDDKGGGHRLNPEEECSILEQNPLTGVCLIQNDKRQYKTVFPSEFSKDELAKIMVEFVHKERNKAEHRLADEIIQDDGQIRFICKYKNLVIEGVVRETESTKITGTIYPMLAYFEMDPAGNLMGDPKELRMFNSKSGDDLDEACKDAVKDGSISYLDPFANSSIYEISQKLTSKTFKNCRIYVKIPNDLAKQIKEAGDERHQFFMDHLNDQLRKKRICRRGETLGKALSAFGSCYGLSSDSESESESEEGDDSDASLLIPTSEGEGKLPQKRARE